MRICIAEDDPVNRRILEAILTECDYEVVADWPEKAYFSG